MRSPLSPWAGGLDGAVEPNALWKVGLSFEEVRVHGAAACIDIGMTKKLSLIDLCRTKRIKVVNIGLCLLNDKSNFL